VNKTAFSIICFVIAGAAGTLGQSQQYKLGRPATPEEIRELDISVTPDGTGLPKGSGTVAQGQSVYKTLCANCRGDRGQVVTQYPALVGDRLGFHPPDNALCSAGHSHSKSTYAVTAFILYLNGIVDEKAKLNEATLPRVKMPNRNGFVPDPRPDVHNTARSIDR
jgi:S-disulfanyl-L-cysteine oxidoreductase SoxD